MLALNLVYLLALEDETIQLSNDKKDLSSVLWDEMERILSKQGRIISSLQKLKYSISQPSVIAQARRFNLASKYSLFEDEVPGDHLHESLILI